MSKQINIGIFGLGTVGKGVLSILQDQKELLKKRSGGELQLTRAVVSNVNKHRGIDLRGITVSDDPSTILDDPSISIVIELIGDLEHSEKIIIESLKRGKSVITANKAVIARKSKDIFSAAYESSAFFGFEAAVGSGIPVIRSIREGFAGDHISRVSGIMNSTTNYILSKMDARGEDYSVALADAQKMGFAEPDPTFDVEGYDAAHKLIVLMDLTFNKLFNYEDLHVEGIRAIESKDMIFASQLGYKIKHIGWAEEKEGIYFGGVHPVMVAKDSSLASVNDAFNAITIDTEFGGPFILNGLGAGSLPAASGVIADVMEAARFIGTEQPKSIYPLSVRENELEEAQITTLDEVDFRYYLRFSVEDKPGVLAALTKAFEEKEISISTMIQKGAPEERVDSVTVLIITHRTKERQISESLNKIDRLSFITEKTRLIRIAD